MPYARTGYRAPKGRASGSRPLKSRDIKILEVTPIEKIKKINDMSRGAKLPKLKYGDVMTIKIDDVSSFWVRCKVRRQWECMITGKPIQPGEYCYRPLTIGVQLWYPENRIREVVIKALLDLEPADNRPHWRDITDREIIDGAFKKLTGDD